MKKIIDWKVFFILLVLSLLSVAAVFPYVITLQKDVLAQTGIPIMTIFLAQIVQSMFMFSVAIFVGMYLSRKIGFKLPILEAVTNRTFKQLKFKDTFRLSVLSGIAIAIVIYFADKIFTLLGASISTSESIAPIWQTLLASFYGGIVEEVLLRLFLMTLFIWIGLKITRSKKPNHIVIIVSILLAAIIFGLGHLPVTAALTTLTPLIVLRAIILNGIGGVVFGILFWKKGLESAIIAHFTTDVFLLTLLPLVLS